MLSRQAALLTTSRLLARLKPKQLTVPSRTGCYGPTSEEIHSEEMREANDKKNILAARLIHTETQLCNARTKLSKLVQHPQYPQFIAAVEKDTPGIKVALDFEINEHRKHRAEEDNEFRRRLEDEVKKARAELDKIGAESRKCRQEHEAAEQKLARVKERLELLIKKNSQELDLDPTEVRNIVYKP